MKTSPDTHATRWLLLSLGSIAASLAGCSGSPPPAAKVALPADLPQHFVADPAPADAQQTATIAEAWWRDFGDARLDAAVERALQHNEDLLATAARVDAALQQARIAGAPIAPQVDLSATANRAKRLFLGFPFGGGGVPSSTVTTYGLSLNVTWEVDLWGRLRSGEAAALADAQAQLADFHGARQSLVAQTCKAYFAIVEARQQTALGEATAAAVRATTEDVRDRFQRGVRPALDAWQAETALAQAEGNLIAQRQRLQAVQRQLEILLGSYPEADEDSAATLSAVPPPVPAGLPSELLARRPDLAAAERRLAATGCRVDVARAALYPRLSLTASGGTNSTELKDLVDDAFSVWSLGANLLQPLLHGGALRADLARAEATQQEAIHQYGGSLLRAFAEVENALADSQWLAERERSATTAAQSAATARDVARERYQSGLTDFLAVLDGQQRAFIAESNRIAIARQRLDNRVDLILALGGGFHAAPPEIAAESAETRPQAEGTHP